MSPISIANAGATGDLGKPATRSFRFTSDLRSSLSPEYYPSHVAEVKFFPRNASSVAAQELISLGVKAIGSGIITGNVKTVHVFGNVLGEGASLENRTTYVKAAAEAGVKVFIPTEFGIDRRNMPLNTHSGT